MSKVITIGSAVPSVGKSVLAANLAMTLARNGVQCLLLDLHPGTKSSSRLVGASPSGGLLSRYFQESGQELPDALHFPHNECGLSVASDDLQQFARESLSVEERQRFLLDLHNLNVDVVVVDLGNNLQGDLLASADVHICMASPELESSMALYYAVRQYAALRVLATAMPIPQAVDLMAAEQITNLQDAWDRVSALGGAQAAVARQQVAQSRPTVLMNRVVNQQNLNISRMHDLMQRYYTMPLTKLADIPDDDAVRRAGWTGQPITIEDPLAPASRAMFRIAWQLSEMLGLQKMSA